MPGPAPPTTLQSRTWTFTDFKVDRLDLFWKSIAVKHLWIGLESGEEHGTKHLQGVVVWLRPYRFSQLKKLVPDVHWEAAKMIDAENYTMKENLVLVRHLSDTDERLLRTERQWTNRDYRDAVIRDIADGLCNKCLIERYPGFIFQSSDKVFRWRYMRRYGCEPPWRKEQWCQHCGHAIPEATWAHGVRERPGAHPGFKCTACGIRACGEDGAKE